MHAGLVAGIHCNNANVCLNNDVAPDSTNLRKQEEKQF